MAHTVMLASCSADRSTNNSSEVIKVAIVIVKIEFNEIFKWR